MYCIMYLKLRSTKKGKALALVGLGLGAKTGVERQSENNNNNIHTRMQGFRDQKRKPHVIIMLPGYFTLGSF